MENLNNIVGILNSFVRDWILVLFLSSIGIYFTFKTRFVQFRKFKTAFIEAFGGMFRQNDEGISPVKALSVAIAGQVGTGNIAGVATCIVTGGPGSIFWMWVMSIFGMATIYAESVLSQKFNEKLPDGSLIGGPSYYIMKGIKNKRLAKLLSRSFSILLIIALGFFGNMTQANSIASSIHAINNNIPLILIGILIAIVSFVVLIGGINRISNFAQLLVPFMAILYIVFSIIILFKYKENILPSFKLIFTSAFGYKQALGGLMGISMKKAISIGVARGLFSNEAGMGTTAHAHGSANAKNAYSQGYIAMFGVFVDTIIICSATALIILVTGVYKEDLNGAVLTQRAFELSFGPFGKVMLAIALTFFAFTTIVAWYYFAESNYKFLFGEKNINIFRAIFIVFIITGSFLKINLVWNLSDLFNSLMVIPNIIALFLLRDRV